MQLTVYALCVFLYLVFYVTGVAFTNLVLIHRTSSTRHAFAAVFAVYSVAFCIFALELAGMLAGAFGMLQLILCACIILNTTVFPILTLWSLLKDLGLSARFALVVVCAGLLFIAYSAGVKTLSWDVAVNTNLYMGVFFTGILSGFAAINTPFNFIYPVLSRTKLVAAGKLVETLSKRQQYIIDAWCSRRRKASKDALAKPTASASSSVRLVSWLRSVISGGSTIELECQGLERVSTALFLEMHELSSFADKNVNNRVLGALHLLLGAILSSYAAWRVISTLISLFFLGGAPVDVFSVFGAASGGGVSPSNLDVSSRAASTSWSTDIGLLINSWMILMALRGFLLAVFRLTTEYAAAISPDTITLAFTTAFGSYAIANFFLSSRFLGEHRAPLVQGALGANMLVPLSVNHFSALNNYIFVVATFVSGLARFILLSTAATE